jgi:hypothetical protein
MMTVEQIKWTAANVLTQFAAFTVGQFRQIKQDELSDCECEQDGLPSGSTARAVFVLPVSGMPWWRLDAWFDLEGDGCFNVTAFGHRGEVHYVRRNTPALGQA